MNAPTITGDSDEKIAAHLGAAGLPFKPCGLNADWSSRAWELPNHIVLLDAELEAHGRPLYAVVFHGRSGTTTLTHDGPLEVAVEQAIFFTAPGVFASSELCVNGGGR